MRKEEPARKKQLKDHDHKQDIRETKAHIGKIGLFRNLVRRPRPNALDQRVIAGFTLARDPPNALNLYLTEFSPPSTAAA